MTHAVTFRTLRDRVRRYHTLRRDGYTWDSYWRSAMVRPANQTAIPALELSERIVQQSPKCNGWWTVWKLEAYARKIGVLRDDETVDYSPRCSRCKSREPARYYRQCQRCVEWSRGTRRDPNRCVDCRRRIDDAVRNGNGVPMIVRCSECHVAKLRREMRDRRLDGYANPLSPFFNAGHL